jgi:hypothetical protein
MKIHGLMGCLALTVVSCAPENVSLDAGGNATPPDAGPFRDADAGALSDAGRDELPDAGFADAGQIADAGPRLDAGAGSDAGPFIDTSNPKLYELSFTAQTADARASIALGKQQAFLDTRVKLKNTLVVHLHGAGAQTTCGSALHGRWLAAQGFHVLMPCYAADYGVANCGTNIGGCRLEAFDGTDRTPIVSIARPDSIEERLIQGLTYLARVNPQGDWAWFLNNGSPRWSAMVFSGISHGASSTGIVSKVRALRAAVMLSGPLDTNQPWLALPSLTPVERVFGFTHTLDPQHQGHLAAFETMGLLGQPTSVDGATPPYGNTHRLQTSAPTSDGHSSTEANGTSPKAGAQYVFEPVWRQMYP